MSHSKHQKSNSSELNSFALNEAIIAAKDLNYLESAEICIGVETGNDLRFDLNSFGKLKRKVIELENNLLNKSNAHDKLQEELFDNKNIQKENKILKSLNNKHQEEIYKVKKECENYRLESQNFCKENDFLKKTIIYLCDKLVNVVEAKKDGFNLVLKMFDQNLLYDEKSYFDFLQHINLFFARNFCRGSNKVDTNNEDKSHKNELNSIKEKLQEKIQENLFQTIELKLANEKSNPQKNLDTTPLKKSKQESYVNFLTDRKVNYIFPEKDTVPAKNTMTDDKSYRTLKVNQYDYIYSIDDKTDNTEIKRSQSFSHVASCIFNNDKLISQDKENLLKSNAKYSLDESLNNKVNDKKNQEILIDPEEKFNSNYYEKATDKNKNLSNEEKIASLLRLENLVKQKDFALKKVDHKAELNKTIDPKSKIDKNKLLSVNERSVKQQEFSENLEKATGISKNSPSKDQQTPLTPKEKVKKEPKKITINTKIRSNVNILAKKMSSPKSVASPGKKKQDQKQLRKVQEDLESAKTELNKRLNRSPIKIVKNKTKFNQTQPSPSKPSIRSIGVLEKKHIENKNINSRNIKIESKESKDNTKIPSKAKLISMIKRNVEDTKKPKKTKNPAVELLSIESDLNKINKEAILEPAIIDKKLDKTLETPQKNFQNNISQEDIRKNSSEMAFEHFKEVSKISKNKSKVSNFKTESDIWNMVDNKRTFESNEKFSSLEKRSSTKECEILQQRSNSKNRTAQYNNKRQDIFDLDEEQKFLNMEINIQENEIFKEAGFDINFPENTKNNTTDVKFGDQNKIKNFAYEQAIVAKNPKQDFIPNKQQNVIENRNLFDSFGRFEKPQTNVEHNSPSFKKQSQKNLDLQNVQAFEPKEIQKQMIDHQMNSSPFNSFESEKLNSNIVNDNSEKVNRLKHSTADFNYADPEIYLKDYQNNHMKNNVSFKMQETNHNDLKKMDRKSLKNMHLVTPRKRKTPKAKKDLTVNVASQAGTTDKKERSQTPSPKNLKESKLVDDLDIERVSVPKKAVLEINKSDIARIYKITQENQQDFQIQQYIT